MIAASSHDRVGKVGCCFSISDTIVFYLNQDPWQNQYKRMQYQRKTIKMRGLLPHRSGFRSSNHALQKSFISGIVEPAAALVAQEAAAAPAVPAAEAAAAVAIVPAHLVVRLEVMIWCRTRNGAVCV